MVAAKDLPKSDIQHIIVSGEPKSGKSTLVSQLAEKYKLIWISVDNGHRVIYKLPDEWLDNIDVIPIIDSSDFQAGFNTCRKLFAGGPVSVCHAHGNSSCAACKRAELPSTTYEFSTLGPDTIVVLDHISQVADSAMSFIQRNDKDEAKAGYDEFGLQWKYMDAILKDIQRATYNVICISHVVETEFDDGTKKIVPQVGTARFSRNAGKYFDHMVFTEVMNRSHRYGSSTTYKTSIMTGSRTDVAIEDMPVPSLLPFFTGEIPKAEVKEKSDAKTLLQKLSKKE
jgi:hypothetical protein